MKQVTKLFILFIILLINIIYSEKLIGARPLVLKEALELGIKESLPALMKQLELLELPDVHDSVKVSIVWLFSFI